MVGQGSIVDAVMLQRLHKTGAVQIVFGDFVGAIEHPKLFVQGMIHFMEFMGAGDAKIFQMVLLVNALKGHFCGGVEVP